MCARGILSDENHISFAYKNIATETSLICLIAIYIRLMRLRKIATSRVLVATIFSFLSSRVQFCVTSPMCIITCIL